MLVSPSRNPVRDQLYEAQIAHHNIEASIRQLKRRLQEEANGGQHYKQAYVRKQISPTDLRKRTNYSKSIRARQSTSSGNISYLQTNRISILLYVLKVQFYESADII
jgi:hypothetical protein